MSDDYQRIEVITGTARRRRWTGEQKLRIIEETYEPGESVSAVARRHGVAANLVFRWRLRIPMIPTGHSGRSRPPIPTDCDHFSGRYRGVV